MSFQPFPSMLLKNGGSDRNMCSLNSNIQLLRHIPQFIEVIHELEDQSALFLDASSHLYKRVRPSVGTSVC